MTPERPRGDGPARPLRAAAAAALLGIAAAGGGGPQPAPAPEVSAEGLALVPSLRQYRSDVALGAVQITLENRGPGTVRVEEVRLDSPAFAPQPATPRDTVLRPGRRVDLPVPHGPARCDAEPSGPHRALARVVPPDGTAVDVTLRLPHADRLLRRIRDGQCAERALRRAVSVDLAPTWTSGSDAAGRPVVHGTVVLRRREAAAELSLEELGGSVIFTVAPLAAGSTPWLVVPPGAPGGEVGVTVTATRCDPHALIESKRTFEFPARVTVAGAEPVRLVLRPGEAGREQLERLIEVSCRPVTP